MGQYVSNAANLQIGSSSSAGLCPIPNLTPIGKEWVMLIAPVIVIVVTILIYFMEKILHKCERIPEVRNHVGALMVLVLTAYQTFALRSIRLFHCVDVATVENQRLFIDGDVSCYAWWQWVVLFIFILLIFPLPVYLYYWRIKTKDHPTMSDTQEKIAHVLETAYSDHAKWWEYAVLYRRLFLVMVSTFADSF